MNQTDKGPEENEDNGDNAKIIVKLLRIASTQNALRCKTGLENKNAVFSVFFSASVSNSVLLFLVYRWTLTLNVINLKLNG